MIKIQTIGGLEAAKTNPVLTSDKEVANYSFIKDGDNMCLILNTQQGDDSGKEGVVFAAGEYLNAYLLKSLEGLCLEIDDKHIEGDYADYSAKKTVLIIAEDGKVSKGSAPAKGVYLEVVGTCKLTEKAVIAKVCVA